MIENCTGAFLLQLQQDVEQRVAVLAAGQADHHFVAFADHAEIGDRAADLVAQAFAELVLLACTTARGRLGLGKRQRFDGGQGDVHRSHILPMTRSGHRSSPDAVAG